MTAALRAVGDAWRTPYRFARGHGGRLALTVLALACGVALVCAIDLVNRAVARAFSEVLDTMAGRAALQVTPPGSGLFPEDTAAAAAAVPGVTLAVPVVSATAFTVEGGESLTIHGVEVTNEAAVRVYEARDAGGLEIADPLEFLAQPDSAIVTRAFAARRALGVGDRLALDTPSGRQTLTVRGLLEPTGVARVYGGNLVVMDLTAAQRLFARPGFINRLDVVLSADADLPAVAAALRAALPAGLRVEAPAQRQADLQRVMRSLQLFLQGVGLVALVAAFLIAFNRLSAVFDARAWQLGVLRAVGLRRAAVWRELVKEGALLGAAGVGLGIPLGIGLGRLMLPVIAATTALNFRLVAPQAELRAHAASFAVAAGMGVGAAVLAALLPARQMARLDVVAALRLRGREPAGAPPPSRLRLLAALGAAIAAGIALQAATRDPRWGVAVTLLVVVTVALAARPALLALGERLRRLARRRRLPSGHLAAAALLQRPRRSALSIAMLGVGLGSVLWLGTIADSFRHSAVDVFSHAMRADLVVGSAHLGAAYLETPVDDALADEIAALPDVRAAIGIRVTEWQFGGGPIALDAFDPAYFSGGAFGRWPLSGAAIANLWDEVARGAAIVVSSNFVQNLGAAVGDTITLDTPSGPLPLLVGAVTTDFASPRGTIEMSRALYARYWNDPQVTRVFVRTAPGAAAAVRDAIQARPGRRYPLRILSAGELVAYFGEQVRRAFAPIDLLAAMTLLVVLFGLADTLGAGVIERGRELGTIRAVGLRRAHLRRLVVAESLLIGVFGLLLAGAAGLGLGLLWVETTFCYLLGWVIDFRVPYTHLAVVSGATLAICLLAALPSARRAASLAPAEALRWE